MLNDLWLNLPVKDVMKSKDFFTAIGFALNPRHQTTADSPCLLAGDKQIVVMLFAESTFEQITSHPIADTAGSTEVLISLGAPTKQAVDDMLEAAQRSGGTIFSPAQVVQGWMYGGGFADPDGRRWNVLYMDMAQMGQGPEQLAVAP